MKREIKFRAWDSKTKKYISSSDRATYVDYGTNYLVRPCIYELEQFTGLHDKNGKEIYEGDMLNLLHESKEYNGEYDGWIISMRDPMYALLLDPETSDSIPLFSFEYDCDFEVIGNIHES